MRDWAGAYEGWDSLMNARMEIYQELQLHTDSTYSNLLGAIIEMPNIRKSKEPAPVEKESGRYVMELQDSVCLLTFAVSYDSVIDFGTQTFIGYPHKHYHALDGSEYDKESYTLAMRVEVGEGGSYRLLTADSTLFSMDGLGNPIPYYLDVKVPE